jgi:hypothetical protein
MPRRRPRGRPQAPRSSSASGTTGRRNPGPAEHRRGHRDRLLRGAPQVGWVDFTQDADGEVTGRTDQGCSWQFALESGELQLATQGQTCFNKVIGSKYQMNRWTVSVTGNREQEYIQATSFLPSGNFNFTLAQGARTKVNQASRRDVANRYDGDWSFNPANPATGVNIENVVSASGTYSEQAVTRHRTPHRGQGLTAGIRLGWRRTASARPVCCSPQKADTPYSPAPLLRPGRRPAAPGLPVRPGRGRPASGSRYARQLIRHP